MFPWAPLNQITIAVFALSTLVAGQSAPVKNETGVSAWPFELTAVTLTSSRFMDNQARTLTYLKFIDLDRMLYVFRNNHKLSTNGATANGGWDAPDFPFRSHMQGHLLTAWSQCWASLKDTTCRDRAISFVAELSKCQANNAAAGFATGYLSGFPESEFAALENGTLSNGNVPWYAMHKTLSGLLDVWRWTGDATAKSVTLALGGWVDTRTSKLSTSQMQTVMNTEFGGMNQILADIYYMTGDSKWITAAARFDHAAVFDPLAANTDSLNGLHANTQVPKWIGAAREYKATGTTRYKTIATNAWNIAVNYHTYAIGGNSQAEHFRAANAIAGYLNTDTAESCNTYNMLKLTRELWTMSPTNAAYFDFYERALLNQMLGQQNPSNSHGHVTYFTSLNPGGTRGVGPAWGGGTWSTDYTTFWCCQGTGVETHTKFADSVFFYDSSSIYVNLFIPAKVTWSLFNVTIAQTTTYPVSDTTMLTVTGSGTWAMRIRIPGWTSGAKVSVNGVAQSISVTPGSYAVLSRTWTSGDVVTVQLPMSLRLIAANDNANLVAVAFGPTILAGNYGSTTLSTAPTLTLSTIKRTSNSSLAFTATANSTTVNLGPFYDAQGFNYVVYWTKSGSLPTSTTTTTTTTNTTTTTSSSSGGCTAAHWAQCGGSGFTGCTTCESGYTCTYQNDWYSQCL